MLSIIIINYNTKQITLDCLQSIYRSKPSMPFEIILIDNASTDDSVTALEEFSKTHDNLKVIKNKENSGFARANNQGVHLTKGEYILLLNSDIVVLDDAINKLYDFYTQNEKKVQFVGGKLLNKDNSDQPSCGPFYSLPVTFGFLFLKGDSWGLTRYSPNAIKEVDWVSGACILTKKEHFDLVSGFDEKIFMYMDEIDLLYRAKQTGFHVYFYPLARFIHLGSASSSKTFPILQVYKGLLYFYHKHHPEWQVYVLKYILLLKAAIALTIGKTVGNRYLAETYGQAYEIAKMG